MTSTGSTRAQGRSSATGWPQRPRGAQRKSMWLTVTMLAILAYFMLPIFWLLVASTKSNADLFSSFGLWFADFNMIENIQRTVTFGDGIFVTWVRNTVFYAVVGAVGSAFFASAAGYAFAKYDFPADKLLFAIALGAIMIPPTALALPTYLLFAEINLTDTVWAVVLPSLVSPFGVYLMRVYAAEAVPRELLEAGRVDGAGELRIFFRVGFRLLMPGVITVLLFQLVHTWNNYFLPLIMLNSSELYPLTVGLAQWQQTAGAGGGAQALFSIVITGSMLSVAPLVIAFLYLQKYWQTGLGTGGVKG